MKCGMTENGSDSLPFEPPEQENVRLRARRTLACGGFWRFTAFRFSNFATESTSNQNRRAGATLG